MDAEELITFCFDNSDEILSHFNPNHDPRNGRFAKSNLGASSDDSDRIKSEKMKKAIRTGAIFVGVSLALIGTATVMGLYMERPHNYGQYFNLNNLTESDYRIKAGDVIRRISSKSVEEYTDEGRTIYASLSKTDAALYKTVLPKLDTSGIKKHYELKFTANRDINIASRKKAYDIYLQMADAHSKGRSSNDIKKVLGPQFDPQTLQMRGSISFPAYRDFVEGLIDRNHPITKEYVRTLKSLGYDGVFDENDYGYSKMPVILFNPKEIVSLKSTHKIGKIEEGLSAWAWKILSQR